MLGRVVAALVGGELGRREGGSTAKGAAIGWLAMSAMRRMGPLGVALGGAYVAKKAYDRRKGDKKK